MIKSTVVKNIFLFVLSILFASCESSDYFSVGGIVEGLSGTVVLQNNGSDNVEINSNGKFLFPILGVEGSHYNVTISSQPINQTCTVTNAKGVLENSNADVLVTCVTTNDTASLSVTNSPLQLVEDGPIGTLTITNNSESIIAENIVSDFTGTALDGNVAETANTCATLVPGASCVLGYSPGSSVVAQTNFSIHGDNTSSVIAAIEIIAGPDLVSINPTSGIASGGTGFTLTGSNLTGATAVNFGGIAATSVNVVNSTTVTGVTPAHAAGAVDVTIATPLGLATLTNGYTYVATSIGTSANGGIVACLNGGLDNLISATADNSTSIEWGGLGVATNAQSNTDGATNTASIVTLLGNNGGTPYATQTCDIYEIDSQGNTPCEVGNACYSDWFVAATNQLGCLFTNRVAIGGFAGTTYWTSTESAGSPTFGAAAIDFTTGVTTLLFKDNPSRLRCVRSFTP